MHNARADLADAGLAVGNARINHRRHVQTTDLTNIDAGGYTAEVERGQAKERVAGDRNVVHLARVAQRVGWCAADELHDGGRSGHGEGTHAAGFRNRAIADIGVGMLRSIASEIQALDELGWPGKP